MSRKPARPPKFSRDDLEKWAKVLGIDPVGLSDDKLLDAISRELLVRREALPRDPAGVPPRRLSLEVER